MSVGVMLVSHNGIGRELLTTARDTLGWCPARTACLEVPRDSDPDVLRVQAQDLIHELDVGDGVLVLTDAYGSTPSNIATALAMGGMGGMGGRVSVVAGLNLPMLLRVFNYPLLSLADLEQKALSGGRDGVILVIKNEE